MGRPWPVIRVPGAAPHWGSSIGLPALGLGAPEGITYFLGSAGGTPDLGLVPIGFCLSAPFSVPLCQGPCMEGFCFGEQKTEYRDVCSGERKPWGGRQYRGYGLNSMASAKKEGCEILDPREVGSLGGAVGRGGVGLRCSRAPSGGSFGEGRLGAGIPSRSCLSRWGTHEGRRGLGSLDPEERLEDCFWTMCGPDHRAAQVSVVTPICRVSVTAAPSQTLMPPTPLPRGWKVALAPARTQLKLRTVQGESQPLPLFQHRLLTSSSFFTKLFPL